MPIFSQGNSYSLTTFTPVDGIASSDVSDLFQDTKNYLWIAHAAGVSRYGGEFENYLFAGETRLGKAFSIIEENNRLWIGAERGLFLFANNALNYISTSGKPLSVYNISKDHAGGLWLSTSDGPGYIAADEISDLVSTLQIDFYSKVAPAWKKQFPSKHVAGKTVADESGIMYVSDGMNIYILSDSSVKLIWETKDRLDPITGLVVYNKDSMYFSSLSTGVHCYENGMHSFMNDNIGDGAALKLINGRLLYYSEQGLFNIEISSRTFHQVFALPEKFWEWGSCAIPDNEQNFWIGTHEHLIHARRKLFSDLIQPSLPGFDELYSIHQSKNGDILSGGNNGNIFARPASGNDFSFSQKIFERAHVSSMIEDDDGNTWFGSGYQGIALIRKGKTRIYTRKDGLRDNTNLFFLKTSANEIYTGGDVGVTKIDGDSTGAVSFKNFLFLTGTENYITFYAGIQEQNGTLLFGSNFGLFQLKNDSLQVVHIQNSSRSNYLVTDIKLDSNNHAWISTVGDGILVCSFEKDGSLKLLSQLIEKDGLHSLIYLNLLIDRNQTVWAVGHAGISRIEQSPAGNYQISNYDQTHGFSNDNFHSVKLMEDTRGTIWIATTSGLFNFNPADALQYNHTLSIELLKAPPQNKLPYNVREVSFEFNSIYLTDPSSVQYVYRLIGSDSNWTRADDDRSVSFRNLDPGKYKFEVKATSGANDWSAPASFNFSIKPPIWTEWWFILTTALGLGAVAVYIIRQREKKIKHQEAEKTELQKLKTISYQYRLEIEQVIGFFATTISKQKSVDDILWDVAKNCISKLGFEDCVIYLKDEVRNVLIQKAAWGPKTTEQNKIINPIEIAVGSGIVGAVAESGKATIVNDTSQDSRYIVDDARRDAEIAVPIIRNGEVSGVIDCEHSQKNFYTDKHLQILTTIASLCADRIDKVIAEQKTRDKEVEVFKLNQDLATSQLTALRSQMNPHFIFNSLNSIAQLVASRQNDEGLQYLAKFSRLLRLVLDESSNNFISLKDEVKMLDLYLQLESLRFGSSFNYTIHIDDDLDEEEIMLPTFLIHPLVENAVWHGLLHKEGERRLIIQFEKKTNEELLCIVKDNGIGIDAALLKKNERLNGNVQPSKGLRIVEDRLALLQQQYGIVSFMISEDMKDGDGFDTGTKVTIQIPLIYE